MSSKRKVQRQSVSNRLVHWGTACSITLLILTGVLQLPIGKRYNLDKLLGEWWIDYFNTLILHYIGAAILIFIVFYHMFVHLFKKEFDIMPRRGDVKQSYLIIKAMLTKGKEPESDKYLAEQRLAYLFIGVNVLLLVFTGLLKMYKNIPGVSVSYEFIFWITMIHNIATVLLIIGIIAHLAAFLLKDNRPLLPGMFTGKVDEDYAKHRHSIWYEKLQEKQETTLQQKER